MSIAHGSTGLYGDEPMKRIFTTSLVAIALLLCSRPAQASLIGTTVFDGDLYSLEQLTATTFRLTVDTDGSNSQNYLTAVAVSLGGDSTGGSLLSDTAPGNWNYVDGGTNSSGCDGSGAAFDCARWIAGSLAYDNGSIYSWTWQILNPALDASDVHLKSVYYNTQGTSILSDDRFAGLQMSQGVTPTTLTATPEPASVFLLGTGIVAIAAKVRSRRRKS